MSKKLSIVVLILLIGCVQTKTSTLSYEEPEIIEKIANYPVFEYIYSLSDEDYALKLDSIKNQQSYDFFSLRMAYSQSEEYSPYGFSIREKLNELPEIIDNGEYEKALEIIDEIHEVEFVNISSHLFAGYVHAQLGDSSNSAFHYSIYEGLLRSIEMSGDGLLPESAYIVISTREEYDFMYWYSLELKRQSLVHVHGHAFDVMETTDANSRDDHTIYFNVTLPFTSIGR